MEDLIVYRRRIILVRTLFSALIASVLILSLYLGFGLDSFKNCAVIPKPVVKGGLWNNIGSLCLTDIISAWLLAIPRTKTCASVTAALVFSFRGFVIGNALRIFFTNSVPTIAFLLFLSYCIITLLMISYTLFLRGHMESGGRAVRILSCIILSGACAVIRFVPYLFIK